MTGRPKYRIRRLVQNISDLYMGEQVERRWWVYSDHKCITDMLEHRVREELQKPLVSALFVVTRRVHRKHREELE